MSTKIIEKRAAIYYAIVDIVGFISLFSILGGLLTLIVFHEWRWFTFFLFSLFFVSSGFINFSLFRKLDVHEMDRFRTFLLPLIINIVMVSVAWWIFFEIFTIESTTFQIIFATITAYLVNILFFATLIINQKRYLRKLSGNDVYIFLNTAFSYSTVSPDYNDKNGKIELIETAIRLMNKYLLSPQDNFFHPTNIIIIISFLGTTILVIIFALTVLGNI